MAAFHGKAGKVTFNTVTTSNVLSWSISAACDVADGSAMDPTAVLASTHWKDYLPGFMSWTATVTCDLDDSGLDPDLDTDLTDEDGAALVLYTTLTGAGGRKYSGTAIVTGISGGTDKDDVAKVTYTFQGSGALSVAAA